jgi:hypothetical protein
MIISSDEKKPDQTPVEQPKRQSQNSTFSAKELSFDPIKLSRIDVKNQKVPRKVDVKTSSSEFSGYLHLILSYLREVNSHLETDANKSLAHKLCIYVKILLKTQETLNANWNEYSNGNMCNHTSTNAHIKAFNNLHSTVKLLSSIMQLVETRFSNYSEESKSKDSKNTLDQLDKKMGELESKLRQFGILVEGDISIPDIPQENSQIKPKSLTPANPSNNPINMNPASGETNSSNIRIEKVLPGQIDIRTKSGSVKNFDSLGKKKNSSTNQSNVADQPRGTTVVKPPQGNEITIVLKPPEK